MHAVERWFAEGFEQLHPRLRALHRDGGELEGQVRIDYGRGLAGHLGRRIARRMGVPAGRETVRLRVRIDSDDVALNWHRVFDDSHEVPSVFRPVGHWPDGHWMESVGALRLALAVQARDGGWCWRPRAAWWTHGEVCVRVPLWLLPRVDAGKHVDASEGYVFDVRVTLPILGLLFAYSGRLEARSAMR